jgi:hypothetical protein
VAADSFINCRVTSETKALVRMLAEREGINESALVKQLLEMVLRMSALGDLTRYRRRTDQTAVQGSMCAWLLKTAGGSRRKRLARAQRCTWSCRLAPSETANDWWSCSGRHVT